MTDLDALYRAILDHPDDDTPRLIYADALEDIGESGQAAFIRAQVEAARSEEYAPAAVRARCFRGEGIPGADWMERLPELPHRLQWVMPPFRRGFPAAVEADDGAAFVAGADRLFELAPVESLDLKATRVAEAAGLAGCEWLSRITRLGFPDGLSGPVARRVFNSPHLTKLTDLAVGARMTVPATAQALVRSRAFAHLTGLSWRDDQRRGGAVVAELTQLPNPPRLKKLDLSGNRITAERLARLAGAPVMARVADLDLSDNNLGPEGVAELAGAELPALRSLHLMRVRPEEEGVRALAGAGFFGDLRSLTLVGNNLGPWAAGAIAGSPAAASLRVLDFRDNRLGDRGAEALAASPHLANLIHLELSSNEIGDRGAAAVAASPHLGGLIVLDLGSNAISPTARKQLTDRFGDRVFL
ncbi:MAG: hypothetical protein JWO38_7385 [Gemmataceae bacterium]|nr:hypothetical protein [Gemmataceae bacterium]